MSEQTPPQSQEAEMSLLGSTLQSPDTLFVVSAIVDPKDFYSDKHRIVYQTMLDMLQGGTAIDMITLGSELENAGLLEKIGGRSYLAALYNATATATGAKYYAQTIKDKSVRRQLLAAQHRNNSVIFDESRDIDSVLAEVQNNLVSITNLGEIDDSAATIVKEVEQLQQEYAKKYESGKRLMGFSSGFESIDKQIDGLRPGHIWVVGAWTSTGKTQFALNIVNAVLEQGVPVAIISLEMSRVDTLARLMGIRNEISSMAILKGKNSLDVEERIEEAKAFFTWASLDIHTTYFDLNKIKMLIRRDFYTKHTKFFVIDYVQNIMSEDGLREYELMTAAATDLQSLARQLGITIYLVSQISNEGEKGQAAGSGFKGSGALEAVADLAIRLKRDKKSETPFDESVPLEIIISKNRHGFTGVNHDYHLWLKTGKIKPKPTGV